MRGWRRHLRAATDATEPQTGAVERLQARAAWPGGLLRQAQVEPAPGALARLRARRRRPTRTSRLSHDLPVAAVAAFAAVVALYFYRPSIPLSAHLSASNETVAVLTPHVALSYTGAGEVTGTESAPEIRWEAGRLNVEVEPEQGVKLSIQTDEAQIRVVGTAFVVTRDAFGTRVTVDRGHVQVSCAGAAPLDLRAEGEVECTPVRAAGWIGRVLAMIRAGHDSDALLAAIDRGQALAQAGDPAIGELEALRIQVLMGAGRYEDAVQAAERYLASGAAPRREEVRALLTGLRAGP